MKLNRKFYDILSVAFILLIAILTFYEIFFVKQAVFESGIGGTITKLLIISFLRCAIVFGYWIFVLILAIKMNSQKLIKVLDVVIIAILIPLSIFFYFLTLRGHFNKRTKLKKH